MVAGAEGDKMDTRLLTGSVAKPQGQGKDYVTLEAEGKRKKILRLVQQRDCNRKCISQHLGSAMQRSCFKHLGILIYLTFVKILLGKYYDDLYFTDKETEIQKSSMTCQMSDGGGRADQNSPGSMLSTLATGWQQQAL